MGTNDGVVSTRLKREDCKHTQHDSAFSEWKILIGPSDWEDHSLGKEGATRYRVHNLPDCNACPGVYEFGIAVPRICSGRGAGKLGPDYIVPVYVGQADNVRTRLQHYGQTGSHLENGSSTGELNDFVQKGLGLFKETFSKGFAIVFRWAPMKNKRDAEKTEGQLLKNFDYAWNKGSNGARRPDDIFQKLNRRTSCSTQSAIVKKLQTFHQNQVGVRIKACKPLLLENGSSIYTNLESNDLLPQIFKFGRSHPRLVSMKFGVNVDNANICGVTLDDGSPCRIQPLLGRKRCEEHKGRRIHGFISASVKEEKQYYVRGPVLESRSRHTDYEQVSSDVSKTGVLQSQIFSEKSVVNKGCHSICGVDLEDGTFCTRRPVVGQKRCEEHKGMRIRESKSKLLEADIPSLFDGSSNSACKNRQFNDTSSQSVSYRRNVDEDFSSTCGATLANGSFCRRQPDEGNKRCWQHKGMRATSKVVEDKSGVFDTSSKFSSCNDWKYNNTSCPSVSHKSVVKHEDFSSTCGATLANGSFCRRQPDEGNKRCWQHKGMRATSKVVEDKSGMFDTSSKFSSCNDWKYSTSCPSVSHNSVVKHEDFSSTCGATLANGSFCRRQPAEGNKRCWQHKGMRASSSLSYKSTSIYDFGGFSSNICGAGLRNGSICTRTPVHGRVRCEQHKGMRAA